MAGVNKVILVGNLGADPELRYTGAGTAVCNLRVATSRRWTDKGGGQQEDTQWHSVVAWSKLAEICKEHLVKGRQVYVEGRLQTREWEDKDGNKRYTTEVVAQDVQFLGGVGRGGDPESRGRHDPGGGPGNDPQDDIPF